MYTWFRKKLISITNTSHRDKSNTIYSAAEFVVFNQIEGDYLEFGVYSGNSFSQSFHYLENNSRDLKDISTSLDHGNYRYLQSKIRYFAFDSFEGFPEIQGNDLTSNAPEHWREGDTSTTKEEFLDVIHQNGVDIDRVTLVKGWYDETLTDETKKSLGIEKAAMVHIDCDFFESTVPCLDFLTDIIHDGSVIIFDDWFRFKNDQKLGVQGATNQWLKKNPQIKLTELARHTAQSMAFIVNIEIIS